MAAAQSRDTPRCVLTVSSCVRPVALGLPTGGALWKFWTGRITLGLSWQWPIGVASASVSDESVEQWGAGTPPRTTHCDGAIVRGGGPRRRPVVLWGQRRTTGGPQLGPGTSPIPSGLPDHIHGEYLMAVYFGGRQHVVHSFHPTIVGQVKGTRRPCRRSPLPQCPE